MSQSTLLKGEKAMVTVDEGVQREQTMVTADKPSTLIWVKVRHKKGISDSRGRRNVYSKMSQSTMFKGNKQCLRQTLHLL